MLSLTKNGKLNQTALQSPSKHQAKNRKQKKEQPWSLFYPLLA
jgi:hypothetical protein